MEKSVIILRKYANNNPAVIKKEKHIPDFNPPEFEEMKEQATTVSLSLENN